MSILKYCVMCDIVIFFSLCILHLGSAFVIVTCLTLFYDFNSVSGYMLYPTMSSWGYIDTCNMWILFLHPLTFCHPVCDTCKPGHL